MSGYYVPSPLLSTGDTVVNVLGHVPTLKELGEGRQKTNDNENHMTF